MFENIIQQDEFSERVRLHQLWLDDDSRGQQLVIVGQRIGDISVQNGNLQNAVMTRCVLERASFVDCNLQLGQFFDTKFLDCTFLNCFMRKAALTGADIRGVNFSGSNLAKVEMDEAIAEHANFSNCDLGAVTMAGADLRLAILENTSFRRTMFGGAKMYNTRKFHMRTFENANVIDGVDVSPNADGTVIIETLEELIAYLGDSTV